MIVKCVNFSVALILSDEQVLTNDSVILLCSQLDCCFTVLLLFHTCDRALYFFPSYLAAILSLLVAGSKVYLHKCEEFLVVNYPRCESVYST